MFDVPPPENDNDAVNLANKIRQWIKRGRPDPEDLEEKKKKKKKKKKTLLLIHMPELTIKTKTTMIKTTMPKILMMKTMMVKTTMTKTARIRLNQTLNKKKTNLKKGAA